MRHVIESVFHSHEVACPYCSTVLTYDTVDHTIVLAERTCPKCGEGFLIEHDVVKRLPAKKRPQKA